MPVEHRFASAMACAPACCLGVSAKRVLKQKKAVHLVMPVGLQRKGLGQLDAGARRGDDAELVDALLVAVVAHLHAKSVGIHRILFPQQYGSFAG